jgi:hypothetical protein
VQSFLYDSFRELATPVFQRLSTSPRDFVANEDFITMDYSDSGDVTGALVATNDIVIPPGAKVSTSNSGCEPGDFAPASATEPQVALIQRGTCDFHIKAENAEDAGYDAAIILNEGQPGRQETLAGTLTKDDLSTIPVIGTSFAIGEELYNQVLAGTVTVRVATTTEIIPDVPTCLQRRRPGARTGRSWSAPTSTPCPKARASTTTARAAPRSSRSRCRWPSSMRSL